MCCALHMNLPFTLNRGAEGWLNGHAHLAALCLACARLLVESARTQRQQSLCAIAIIEIRSASHRRCASVMWIQPRLSGAVSSGGGGGSPPPPPIPVVPVPSMSRSRRRWCCSIAEGSGGLGFLATVPGRPCSDSHSATPKVPRDRERQHQRVLSVAHPGIGVGFDSTTSTRSTRAGRHLCISGRLARALVTAPPDCSLIAQAQRQPSPNASASVAPLTSPSGLCTVQGAVVDLTVLTYLFITMSLHSPCSS